MPVFLAGVTQPGTVINAISGTDVTLSQNALQNASSATFRAGFNMIVVGTTGYIATSLGGETGSWLVRTSGVSNTLNSISASPTTFVAVGTAGRLLTSPDGITWSNQTPPLNSSGQFITDVTGSSVTMSGNAAAGTGVSFGVFKGNTSGNNSITNVNGIQSVRVGIPVFAESGIPAGTWVRSVEATGFTMTTASTVTEASKPIRTFTAVVTAGSSLLTEVSDFKGLAVGMALHGSAFNGTETGTIFGLFPDSRIIWLTRVPPTEGRGSFGVLYGNLTVNSPIVQNVSNLPSIQRRPGTTHFSQGKSVASVTGKIPSNVTVSSYNSALNELTLSSPALSNASDVPLLTFKGVVTNNSSVITGVIDFSELTEGMLLLVTGDAQGADNVVPFYVSVLDDANDTVFLSSAPNLNVGSAPVQVSLGIYTGTIASGSSVVTKIKNVTPIQVPLPKLDDVFWTGSQFIAVGDYGAILTSGNGSGWTSRNSGTGLDLSAVATAGGQILVAGQDGLILSSGDGATWAVSRAADSAAINDLRTVDRIKTIISANGRTVALGNGGLSTATGGTWSTSLNSTFSGTQLDIGLGGIMTIRNEVTFNTRGGAGIIERNQNNTNRIDDAAILNSKGGRFEFSNNGVDNVAYSESIGKLLLSEGQLTIRTTTAGVGGSSLLQFGSLEQKPGATLNFSSRRKDESGDDAALLGANALNRVVFSKNPTLKGGIIGGWATVENDWADYDSTNGVKRLDAAKYQTGGVAAWNSGGRDSSGNLITNVRMSANQTATTALAVNSLNLTGGTLNLAAFRLSVESGGILANSGNPTISGAGMLTVGTALNAPKTLYLINNSSLTINNPILDFESKVNLVLSGSLPVGTIQITLPNVAAQNGLLAGMSVTGLGIAPGTRIETVDTNNRITLTSPTTAVIPTGTELTFKGGSVSLAKSGSGLLTLNSKNDYTGKTYINSGTLLVKDLASLGASPSALVQDHIQINGGTLQIGLKIIC
jgi:autotransporter-associated beta strand protein